MVTNDWMPHLSSLISALLTYCTIDGKPCQPQPPPGSFPFASCCLPPWLSGGTSSQCHPERPQYITPQNLRRPSQVARAIVAGVCCCSERPIKLPAKRCPESWLPLLFANTSLEEPHYIANTAAGNYSSQFYTPSEKRSLNASRFALRS